MTIMHKRPLTNHLIILGFGSVGKAILPLIFQQFDLVASQLTIISNDESGKVIADEYGIEFQLETITQRNYIERLGKMLGKDRFLINLSVNISSIQLIALCKQHDALYLDAAIESWPEGYLDCELAPALRTNYSLRESLLKLKQEKNSPTAVLTHGANPGLVSHFLKQALLNMANDNDLIVSTPKTPTEWASLANLLDIKAIHIAERDTQVSHRVKAIGESVNTWSIDGFLSEASQPAELGWGTHERHWPHDAKHHEEGSQCAIYLNQPGANTMVRTWTPGFGAFHGYLITHAESITIADYLTLRTSDEVFYRPTVHYAYRPCSDAILKALNGIKWERVALFLMILLMGLMNWVFY